MRARAVGPVGTSTISRFRPAVSWTISVMVIVTGLWQNSQVPVNLTVLTLVIGATPFAARSRRPGHGSHRAHAGLAGRRVGGSGFGWPGMGAVPTGRRFPGVFGGRGAILGSRGRKYRPSPRLTPGPRGQLITDERADKRMLRGHG